MRIESRPVGKGDRPSKKRNTESENWSFLDVLKEQEALPEIRLDAENVTADDLRNLAGMIEQFGEALSNNPTPDNFTKYKKHIQLFVRLIQDNFEVQDTNSRISFSKQKLYKTVESLDSILDGIARDLLAGEKDRLSFLKLTGQIRGLIIDLIM